MRYRDEKFYWTYQHGVSWPNDYLGPDSVIHWILEVSDGFTDVVCLRFRKVSGLCIFNFKVQMKCFFLFPNLKEQQKSGRLPFTVS